MKLHVGPQQGKYYKHSEDSVGQVVSLNSDCENSKLLTIFSMDSHLKNGTNNKKC